MIRNTYTSINTKLQKIYYRGNLFWVNQSIDTYPICRSVFHNWSGFRYEKVHQVGKPKLLYLEPKLKQNNSYIRVGQLYGLYGCVLLRKPLKKYISATFWTKHIHVRVILDKTTFNSINMKLHKFANLCEIFNSQIFKKHLANLVIWSGVETASSNFLFPKMRIQSLEGWIDHNFQVHIDMRVNLCEQPNLIELRRAARKDLAGINYVTDLHMLPIVWHTMLSYQDPDHQVYQSNYTSYQLQ